MASVRNYDDDIETFEDMRTIGPAETFVKLTIYPCKRDILTANQFMFICKDNSNSILMMKMKW